MRLDKLEDDVQKRINKEYKKILLKETKNLKETIFNKKVKRKYRQVSHESLENDFIFGIIKDVCVAYYSNDDWVDIQYLIFWEYTNLEDKNSFEPYSEWCNYPDLENL
jgi:hypothetical protein